MAKARKYDQAVEIEPDESQLTQPPKVEAVGFTHIQQNANRVTDVVLVERVVKNTMVVRNIPFPGCREAFMHQPEHQSINRYFPLAEGGGLYVDRILGLKDQKLNDDMRACEIKRGIMKKCKLRYLVLFDDSDMLDVDEQLEN